MSEDDRWIAAGAFPAGYRKWWFAKLRARVTVCRRHGHDCVDGRCTRCYAVC